MYTEKRVKTIDELQAVFNKQGFREWVYRGQSDSSWKLETSLYRNFERLKKLQVASAGKEVNKLRNDHERLMINSFKGSAHLYLSGLPDRDDLTEWISIMQHYDAPTRILDFTFSPFVALFFALNQGEKDSSMFCFNVKYYSEINEKFAAEENIDLKDQLFKGNLKEDKSYFVFYEPKMLNLRQKAQKGLFLIPSNNYETFETILKSYPEDPEKSVKLVIPKELRVAGLKMLLKMNVSADILFPGIEGFCRSLANNAIFKNTLLERIS